MTRFVMRSLIVGAMGAACYCQPLTTHIQLVAQEPLVDGSTEPDLLPEPIDIPAPIEGALPDTATESVAGEPLSETSAEVSGDQSYGEVGQRLDLFYNYYVSGGGGVPAGMYPAPRPTPSIIGHVYYTYQPLLPHEYLYPHYREYWTYYGNWHGYNGLQGRPSINRTMVRWQRGNIRPSYLYTQRPPTAPPIPSACPGHCHHGGGFLPIR